jgi:hypothetical protein
MGCFRNFNNLIAAGICYNQILWFANAPNLVLDK